MRRVATASAKPQPLTPTRHLGYRTQFFAIEILRNRRGLNDPIYEQAQAEKAANKAAP